MTTFIKAKLKKSDDQTKFDKYRVAGNITVYHIISKLIIHDDKVIISYKNVFTNIRNKNLVTI